MRHTSPHPFLRIAFAWPEAFGINPLSLLAGLRNLPGYLIDCFRFRSALRKSDKSWPFLPRPCLHDRNAQSGAARGHYFHQDLLVARKVFQRNPRRHVDVGSRIDGFVAHVAAFREIEVFDIRPLDASIPNVTFRQFDIMKPAPEFRACCDSLSCLHTLEHFGLGRYGDPIDPEGHIRGFETLLQLLEPGGLLYLSVPIGKQRVEFNAHRVFDPATILAMAGAHMRLEDFHFVNDAGDLHEHATRGASPSVNSAVLWYGLGIFEFRKTPP